MVAHHLAGLVPDADFSGGGWARWGSMRRAAEVYLPRLWFLGRRRRGLDGVGGEDWVVIDEK